MLKLPPSDKARHKARGAVQLTAPPSDGSGAEQGDDNERPERPHQRCHRDTDQAPGFPGRCDGGRGCRHGRPGLDPERMREVIGWKVDDALDGIDATEEQRTRIHAIKDQQLNESSFWDFGNLEMISVFKIIQIQVNIGHPMKRLHQ